ncbi:hypothetical protein Ana3638_00855 [Anaerocolumna sedimenticola]|uniref:Uncharacterized protein n=1 Tax=Anaerocolumna sedimenticola TaxID=2696063 RepID=A0A6P1TGH7_9FIRM|nr:hypothetical protein [Anaerocolumna sedimenticola]QHQ59523.1 hypothetical protein Ana3638_00855 [Anaerocolumna sedimenticola]
MNELLLIDMMSELNPELLQDDYMEKDMKRGKSFFKLLFSFKKTSKCPDEFPVENPISEGIVNTFPGNYELEAAEDIKSAEVAEENENLTEENEWGFHIGIFEKKFRNLFKIISGIAATAIVIVSIIVIILKRHKSGIKLHREKIQIIY